ncbi:MAG: hypothetical protein ACOCY0_04165, partial [Roseicyclus sp.]
MAQAPGRQGARAARGEAAWPTLAFLLAATAILGTAAVYAASGLEAEGLQRDIWQHAAALLALMENLAEPANPFVASPETSRHFHPLWLAFAALGRALDLSVWQLLGAASVFSMAVLALGIHLFARAFFREAWAPLVLLLTLTAGWLIQPQHTGLHSFHTLLYGAPYPATMMIGASLILWALTIRALEAPGPRACLGPLLLGGAMVMTHQLGAVIGLIGAGCFASAWPGVGLSRRGRVGASLLAGVALSFAWPYHGPLALMAAPGNSSWEGGFPFYDPTILAIVLIPAVLGLAGLRGARARPLALALLAYGGLLLHGLTGPQVAGRFLMPVALVLHVGLAGLILRRLGAWRWPLAPATPLLAIALLVPAWLAISIPIFESRLGRPPPGGITYLEAARALTADIPDVQEVAADGILAWPV